MRTPRRLAAVVLLVAAQSAPASVLVVGPGEAFSQITSAVTAAQDGDTILVKTGNYAPFTIEGKGLTVVADQGAAVFIGILGILPQRSTVRNLLAQQTVVLRGIDGPLAIYGNTGTTRLEDCDIVGERGDCSPLGCVPPTPGVLVAASPVAITRCTLTGGAGGSYTASGFDLCTNGGPGLYASNAEVVLYDTTLAGGPGPSYCTTGPPFESFLGTGSFVDGLAPQHGFMVASPTRTGQVVTLDFTGPTGDGALLLLALHTDLLPAPQYQGVLLVGPIAAVIPVGAIPPSGTLSLAAPNGTLPPAGVQALDLHLQAAYQTSGGYVLAAPSIVTLLDPSF